MMVNGEDVTRAASMVKLKAGRLSREVADSCLQVQQWGGEGSEFIERLVRDGRLTSIGINIFLKKSKEISLVRSVRWWS